MESVNSNILSINAGSSSIKFALFEVSDSIQLIFKGVIERIGQKKSSLFIKGLSKNDSFLKALDIPNYAVAATILMDFIENNCKHQELAAIGHRLVHGGSKYSETQRITKTLIENVQQISSLDPEHLPEELSLVKAFQSRFPNIPQIACFDTYFHRTIPRIAKLLTIPRRYEAQGIHKYGFHGLSYSFLMEELTQQAGSIAAQGRVILAHLGNGASLAAVKQGKSMDTSMGFTPTAGIPAGTRSGSLDPGLFWYLVRVKGMDAKEFNDMTNYQSGLLGISETSSDMRNLLELEKQDSRAADAINLFCYEIKKYIGAYAATLGGLDTLIFSGGIGEQSSQVRSRICEELGFLGINLDDTLNAENQAVISIQKSPVTVRVIKTNEELMIAKMVSDLLKLNSPKEQLLCQQLA